MTSVLTASPSQMPGGLPGSAGSPAMGNAQKPSPPHQVKMEPHDYNMEEDGNRERQRSGSASRFPHIEPYPDVDADGEDVKDANSSNSEAGGPVRKRRRSRKGLDKKFECSEKDCGKTYSRAEHLSVQFPPCSLTQVTQTTDA